MQNTEQDLFTRIGRKIQGAEQSQMFGKPCFKVNQKAFICYFEHCMVFKLSGAPHKEALSLKDSVLFDPSGKGRFMKEWVQVSFEHKNLWENLAFDAFEYVKKLNK